MRGAGRGGGGGGAVGGARGGSGGADQGCRPMGTPPHPLRDCAFAFCPVSLIQVPCLAPVPVGIRDWDPW